MDRYLRELQSPEVPTKRHWRFATALALAFALLIAIGGYGVVQNQRAAAARAFVARSLAVQDALLRLDALVAIMEVEQRGFLLTADPAARARRDDAYRAARRLGQSLSRLVAADPLQAPRGRELIAAFERRHARMLATSAIASAQGLEAAREAFREHGLPTVDPLFALGAAMRQDQARRMLASAAGAEREARDFRRVVVYGAALALLAVALTSVLMLRQLGRNLRLGRQLAAMHRLQQEKALELERSNRELEAFSYTVSHDLRAPLRHVDGYARMLQEDAGDQLSGDLRRYLDMISDSSRRMGALIDDLLAYSRLGRKPLEPVRLDMQALTERVLPDAGAGERAAAVEIGPLPEAWADPVLMRQAWTNLLSNALKYSAPRGAAARIEVSGERAGGVTRYRIRDNGVGFDMRYADKLFGVFQRMHSQDDFEGTGVGLAIVQQVVQRHGGRVLAEASPGNGACFTVELPTEGA